MIRGFFNLPWFLWAGLALLITIIYFFVWPRKALTKPTGFRFFLLRDLSSLDGAADFISLAGGGMYVLFIFMTSVTR